MSRERSKLILESESQHVEAAQCRRKMHEQEIQLQRLKVCLVRCGHKKNDNKFYDVKTAVLFLVLALMVVLQLTVKQIASYLLLLIHFPATVIKYISVDFHIHESQLQLSGGQCDWILLMTWACHTHLWSSFSIATAKFSWEKFVCCTSKNGDMYKMLSRR